MGITSARPYLVSVRDMRAYDRLMEKSREISLVYSISMLMSWDQDTYMPSGAVGLRSDQSALLETIRHRMLTSAELKGLVAEAQKEDDSFDEVQARNLYLLKRDLDIATSVPEELVSAHAKQASVARDAWVRAREAKDWRVFEPELERMFDLSVRMAEATMEAKGAESVFDSMIDECERGMKEGEVAEVLTGLRSSLVPLADRYSEASRSVSSSFLLRKVPLDAQREVVKDAVNLVGYDTVSDEARGRIDATIHPFTAGYYDDVRITVRYKDDGVIDALLGGMHEAGHALYEQNMNRDWMYQPLGHGTSMGVHESSSRFVENMIGTSSGFWSHYLPRFKDLTGPAFADVDLGDFLRGLNRVSRSKTRTAADEVTYCLHISIRFEIERALFSGKASIKELPQMWNDLYDKYLQVEIEDDVEGVMQDIHWSMGGFGYFQSYALGNVYDGMYVKKLDKDLPEWRSELEAGKLGSIMDWLRDKVHLLASKYDAKELVERAAGEPLTSEPYIKYLDDKQSRLWA